ncbi:sugar-binding protein [Oceanihabitans sp. 2_MG-2023]|uniref:sugar-binding protein n=1 Tax=Oceanihabitans sp. 2_MG-2023 TaxID=3062661 RepID=UPI0026E12185|nr:sugar-binding protein [Oceanihabitans sp. 2_MG-2023]MDO6597060.1 sugar-binding protein [Oceanihabitans sp. 2_MG-2023]
MKKHLLFLVTIIVFLACKQEINVKPDNKTTIVKKTLAPIIIDGKTTETIWQEVNWHKINQNWLGDNYTEEDFKGQYKLTWDEKALYALVEIQDDILYDQYKDPLKLWWDDDCVEVFIDEDNSGGEHQYNHNAFAYHVALDGNVVDIAPGEIPTLYNNHVQSKRITNGKSSIWELKINIHTADFVDGAQNTPITLHTNKKLGFAIAYCDNDASLERENFIGSEIVEGKDKNRGWIDASIFGTLLLKG